MVFAACAHFQRRDAEIAEERGEDLLCESQRPPRCYIGKSCILGKTSLNHGSTRIYTDDRACLIRVYPCASVVKFFGCGSAALSLCVGIRGNGPFAGFGGASVLASMDSRQLKPLPMNLGKGSVSTIFNLYLQLTIRIANCRN